MANFFTLTLDTTNPSNPSLSLESGAQYATNTLINATIGTSDGTTTGYQMKIWGADLDLAWCKTNGIVSSGAAAVDEASALWITYATSKQLQITSGDGSKTVYLKIRDDVYNESAQASDSIILNTTLPVVTISAVDVAKVSKISGKDVASFSFQCDVAFAEYKVKVVSASGNAQDTGTVIGTTNGSTNMSGVAGNYAATTPINCTIKGADLETASNGDGAKVIKIFVKNAAGLWSA